MKFKWIFDRETEVWEGDNQIENDKESGGGNLYQMKRQRFHSIYIKMWMCVWRGSGSAVGEITIIVSQYFTLAYMLKLNYLSVTLSRLPRFCLARI